MHDSYRKKILDSISPKLLGLLEKNLVQEESIFRWVVSHPFHYQDPLLLPDMAKAIAALKNSIVHGKKIALFGDKDVDGITAISTMCRFLDALALNGGESGIHNRKISYSVFFEEETNADYGLTEKIVQESFAEGCSLLFAFDTGTSDFEAIRRAIELGMEVVVIDHHEPKGELPRAQALVNPKRSDSLYPFRGLATAALVWKFCHAFLISSGRTHVFFQEIDSLLRIEIRQDGAILALADFSELTDYLQRFSPGEIQSGFRFLAAHGFIKQKYKSIFSELKIFNLIEEWPMLAEDIFSSLEKNSSSRNGFQFWGNPLTGMDGFPFLKTLLLHGDQFLNEVGLARAFQILQLSASGKLDNLLFPLLSLVSVGTLADMMPLEDENRIFVRYGISRLRQGEDKCFQMMMDRMGIWGRHVRSRNLSWSMIPVLNSPGRIGSGSETLNFLLSTEIKDRLGFLETLLEKNRQRKNYVEIGRKRALEQVEKGASLGNDSLIIVMLDNLPFGISGLVASRMADYFLKPSVVLVQNEEKTVGSARSFDGFNVLEMIEEAASFLLLYGGHKEAAGFSFLSSKKDEILGFFLKYAEEKFVQNKILPKQPVKTSGGFLEISINEIDLFFVKELDWTEPFGVSNPEPLLLIKDIPCTNFKFIGKNREHGKFSFTLKPQRSMMSQVKQQPADSLTSGVPDSSAETIKNDSASGSFLPATHFDILGWDMAEKMQDLSRNFSIFPALAELDLNYFRGEVRINIILHEILI